MLNSWHDSIFQAVEFLGVSTIAVSGGLWLLGKNRPQVTPQMDYDVVDGKTVNLAIAKTAAVINQLSQVAANHPALLNLQENLAQLSLELDRKEIRVAVTGGKSVGKSAVMEILKNVEILPETPLHFSETAPLFTEPSHDTEIFSAVQNSDFVLFLTNGDLTDSEFQALQQLKSAKQPTMLVFSKQDQYMSDERLAILASLKQHFPGKVVATAAAPLPGKVQV